MMTLQTILKESRELEWGLLVMSEQEAHYRQLLEMSEVEWVAWSGAYIKKSKHVRKAIRFVSRVAGMRDSYVTHAMRMTHYKVASETESLQVDMNLLRDMVDEPEKYGDDIAEALELEQQLLQTRKAWRVNYMWVRKEQEVCDAPARVIQTAYKQHKINQKNIAATKIQAAWRGFETRCEQRWTDCARCLCHRVSYWMIGGPDGVCEDCYREVCPYYDQPEYFDEIPPEERFPDYEERDEQVCEFCERRAPMVGDTACSSCYRDEKRYKHDEL